MMKKIRNEIFWMLGVLVLFSWCIGFVHSNRAQITRVSPESNHSVVTLIPLEKFLDYIQHFLVSRSVDRIVELLVSLPADEAFKRARIIIEEQDHDLLREDEIQLIAALADHYKRDKEAQKKFFELILFDPIYYQNKPDEEPFGYIIAQYGYAEILPALQDWAKQYYVTDKLGKRLAIEVMGDFVQNAMRRVVEKDEDSLLRAMHNARISISKGQATALLLYAAQLPRATGKVIAFLKERGADLNVVDTRGNTPLIYAVKNNNRALIEALLRAGVDVNAMPSPGTGTALQLARTMNFVELELLLRKHGAKD